MIEAKPVLKLFLTKKALISALVLGVLSGSWIESVSAADIKIEGRLVEKGTRNPLVDARVYILPHKLKAITDSQGRFVFEAVPEGEIEWVVNLPGYQKLSKKETLQGAQASALTLYVEKNQYQIYETTVFGKGDKKDDTTRSLKASQITQIAGSGNDPVRAIQNLPGVNRPPAFASQVVIQGSAPQDTRYQIDGHEVPLIFHFGGLSSVVPPETLDRVDYLSAGYGPENGRATAGLVTVVTRSPRKDRLHGLGFVDTFNAGALVDGPVGEKGSFLLGVRKSYIGAVLRAILPKSSQFDLTAAPSFSDLTGIYETEVTPIDRLKVVTVGSMDSLEFLFKQPVDAEPSLRGNFSTQTSFFRIIPQVTHRHSERTQSRWSLGLGKDWNRVDLGEDYFYLNVTSLTSRAEVERKMSSFWTGTWGLDNRQTWARVDLLLPDVYSSGGVFNPFSSGEKVQRGVNAQYNNLGFYWKNAFTLGEERWTLLPCARADYFSSTREWIPQPRLGLRYRWNDSTLFRINGGSYSQPPLEQEVDSVVGNPNLKAPKAWHLSAGVEKDLREGSSRGWIVSTGGFYKYLTQLVIPTSATTTRNGEIVPLNFNNEGRGRVYGGEALIRAEFLPFTGWLSYTLSRSTRWDTQGQAEYVFRYDQTHLLAAVGNYQLPRNWSVGARIRFTTGTPYTPIVGGALDADNDVFIPVRGAFYSERLKDFFQLDLRVDKKWIYDDFILSLYLDIQNATNRQNLESVRYSYNYSQVTQVSGLPILPTFGLKAEF